MHCLPLWDTWEYIKGDCMHEIDRKDKTGMMKEKGLKSKLKEKPVT